jgi:ABC-type glycerol-3-phosphate transport system permease component
MTSIELGVDAAAKPVGRKRGRVRWRPAPGICMALAGAMLFAAPMLYAFYVSLIDLRDLWSRGLALAPMSLENYIAIWDMIPLARFFLNSIIVSLAITAGSMLTSIMAAYALARMEFAGASIAFMAIIATLMIPAHITLIPNYLTISALDMRNTYWALILPFLASGFATFFLRQQFRTVPVELEDAARIDKAGPWKILWDVIVPVRRPAVAAIAVFVFLAEWNSYIWPLIVIDSVEMRTVEVGIARLFAEEAEGGLNDWPLMIAGALSIMVPPALVFVIAERHLVQGVTVGSIK